MRTILGFRPCLGPGCTRQVPQLQGCRRHETCSNACRQRLYQQRKRERAEAMCRVLWQHWPEGVQQCLEAILDQNGPTLATQTARTINDVCCPGDRMPL